ncbi:MAG: glycosyltransferase [Caldilineales bacterium]|nr:glycosyltransferase [Caldilineales bacterium]
MTRQKVCILSLENIQNDGRVLRQIEYAAREYDVTFVGWGQLEKPIPHVTMKPVQQWIFPPLQRSSQIARMFMGRVSQRYWEKWYWAKPDHQQALATILQGQYDLIHVDEAIALPIGVRAAEQLGTKLLFDAHEYSPEQAADKLWGRLLAKPFYEYIIQEYAPRADAMITVAPGIAERYARELNRQVEVIMNVPIYQPLHFRPTNPQSIRMIYHGAGSRDRRLEALIQTVGHLDVRFSLDLMLVIKDPAYLAELQQLGTSLAPGRVRFRPAVPPDEIASTVNEYDIGMPFIPPVNYNHAHSLPNKFFEYMMAGLAVAIGPSVEMQGIVEQYGVGVIAAGFEPAEMAERLLSLTSEEIDSMKQNSLAAAKLFNADYEMGKLLSIYHRLLT